MSSGVKIYINIMCSRGLIIGLGINIREYGSTLCRINRDVSGANTKVYWDGHVLFSFPVGLRQADENMEGRDKIKCS